MSAFKTLAFGIVMFLVTASSAYAQRGGSGGQSGLGNTGLGAGGTGAFGSAGLGSSGFGSSGFGGGGGLNSGAGGFGTSGFGGGGFGTGSGFGTSGLGGTGFGQSTTGIQGNQGFIGRDSADMTSVFNQLGRNSNQFFQQMNRSMQRGNRDRRSAAQEENSVMPVRVRLEVTFDRPPTPLPAVATAVRGRLDKLFTRRSIVAPDVELVGETIVLRGEAASESQRLVIEKLVSMEPGVFAVENQMTVRESSPPEPPAPPVQPTVNN